MGRKKGSKRPVPGSIDWAVGASQSFRDGAAWPHSESSQKSGSRPQDGGNVKKAETGKFDFGGQVEADSGQADKLRGPARKRRGLNSTVAAAAILREIGNSFADIREMGGRSEAWSRFQSNIMRNLDVLVPNNTASLDICVSLSLRIEDFLKSEQAYGKAPGDLFAEWLKGNEVKQ